MWEEKRWMDCCLRVCEGSKPPVDIRAHRCVLAAASRIFRSMLTGPLRERDAQVLELNEVGASPITEMLMFMYGLEVEISAENALSLYRVADMYEVLELATLCCTYLQQKTTVCNCCSLLAAA
eukprot:CAMPEP_0183342482 /NCGR_PEP_ID=MMETSP0164_2-20130417/8582_1 /TAXON_ID=221442 /ORGANISM="Coccolithus pelagicus ssp braarudi, Strain PLY182g" /LENGTH=122 /DNA_ID=CAMNT_0025513077 /DNA_START=60 /DNA_END=424 /DNA_ORIENTATION=-